MKKLISTLAVCTAAILPISGAHAADYPERPLTWIVPFAAGGPTDAMARHIANKVAGELGQSIIIENAPGAGGTIGTIKASREKPDGYSFLVGHIGYMAAAPSLYSSLSYNPAEDFEAVFRFPDTPLVLLVGEKSRFKTASELVAYGKQHPDQLNFSNAGVGSTSHLVAAMFAAKAGIQVQSIAYRGAGPALNDLMGGQVDAMFDQTNTALPQVKGGKVRALGLTSAEPMEQFPGVPVLSAESVPDFTVSTWYGLYAPKGTPRHVIDTLYAAYRKVMSDKAFTDTMESQGIMLLGQDAYSPDALQKHTKDEILRWKDVIDQAGIKLD